MRHGQPFAHMVERESQPALAGSQCTRCAAWFFPAQDFCSECWSDELLAAPVPGKAKIHSVTTVWRAAPQFTVPYHVGWIDFDVGVRVFGRVVARGETPPRFGDPVEVGTAHLFSDAGQDVWGFAFLCTEEAAA